VHLWMGAWDAIKKGVMESARDASSMFLSCAGRRAQALRVVGADASAAKAAGQALEGGFLRVGMPRRRGWPAGLGWCRLARMLAVSRAGGSVWRAGWGGRVDWSSASRQATTNVTHLHTHTVRRPLLPCAAPAPP